MFQFKAFFILIVPLSPAEKPGTVWQKLRRSKKTQTIDSNDLISYKSWAMKPETTPKAVHHGRKERSPPPPRLPAECPLGDKRFQREDLSVTLVTAPTLVLHQRKGCRRQRAAGPSLEESAGCCRQPIRGLPADRPCETCLHLGGPTFTWLFAHFGSEIKAQIHSLILQQSHFELPICISACNTHTHTHPQNSVTVLLLFVKLVSSTTPHGARLLEAAGRRHYRRIDDGAFQK